MEELHAVLEDLVGGGAIALGHLERAESKRLRVERARPGGVSLREGELGAAELLAGRERGLGLGAGERVAVAEGGGVGALAFDDEEERPLEHERVGGAVAACAGVDDAVLRLAAEPEPGEELGADALGEGHLLGGFRREARGLEVLRVEALEALRGDLRRPLDEVESGGLLEAGDEHIVAVGGERLGGGPGVGEAEEAREPGERGRHRGEELVVDLLLDGGAVLAV